MTQEPTWTGRSYRYRVEDLAPGIEWRRSVLSVPDGWKAWACLTSEHRYHRTKEAAATCAGIILPRIEQCQIIGGAVVLDPALLRAQLYGLKTGAAR
jgi:hypothetical protein